MKNVITYLKTLWRRGLGSQSSDISLDCRLTVGSPSVKCRLNLLRLVSVMALLLTIGVGNAWADYTVGFATSGSTVIASGSDYVSDATRGGNTYIESDGLRFGKSGGTGSITVTLTSSGTYVGQIKASKITLEDVKRYGSDASVNVKTTVTYTDDATTVDNYTAPNSASDHDISLISSKTIKSVKIESTTNTKRFYCKGFTVVAAASCAKKVTITKGTPETGGSFNLDKTGAQDCCDALTVTVSSIVAPSGKKFSAITQSGIASGVTINQSAKTVTYAANTTGSSTINVTYEAKGCSDKGASSITSTSGGNSYTYGPVDEYYKYSTRQILYSKSDLGLSSSTKKGTIKSIYFKYKHTAAMTSKTSVNIYMANTHLTSLSTSSYVPYSEFTLVYSGSLNCTTTNDWNEFFLDTPFEYNGAGNLVVMIDDNSNAYDGSSFTFYYHAATGAQIYTCSDSDNENPATTDWSGYTATSNRPTTKFCIQEADMVQSTVTWVAGSNPSFGSQTDYEGTALSNPGTPSAASYCPGGKVFVGWTETPIVGEGSAPADLFTSVSGKSIPVGGTTYYAVFATSGSSSKTYQFDITPSQFNTTSYVANNNQKSNTATATDASGATMTVYWTSNQIMKNSSDMQWQKGSGYIYNSTDLGTVNSVTITNSAGGYDTWYGTTEHPTSGSQGSGKGFFTVKENNTATGKSTQVRVNFTKTITTYSNYATSCCTPLGTINGSVSWSNAATAVVSWDNIDHVSSWTVKYKTHAAGDFSTWAGEQTVYTKSTTNDSRKVTITGLTPCTNYDFQIIANPASGYCDKDQTIEDSQTHNLTVTKTGVTNVTAASLSAIPATTCASGFGPITITAATGYALPADITVTNATKSWNSSTGALSISSVTGNVSITITPTCVPPVVTGDPADASYYVGDAPEALSVTATLASGTRTYLWKVSTDNGDSWSNAAGTNNLATYSGASLTTASAGTIKFKCIVGNSQGGCTVESGVATITVNAASSWKLKGSWDSWEEHTMIEDAGVASYSISLDADSRFEFCFAGGSVYKNSGTMITTTSGWTFNTSDNNCKIHTGPAGTYTFAINTSTKSVTVTYPTVTHPNDHYVYFKNTDNWGTVYGYLANSGNDNKAAAWPGSVMQPTTTICGETYHYAALNAMSGTYNVINFNDGGSGYGHQTSDLSTTGSLGKYNANQDASWHQFKYAINFDKGTGSGDAMVSIENLCPGSDQALTANTYTKEHNTFAGWIADVDVKVGESTIDAGEIIDDEVTIKDIQSDINLTAQWTPNTYTITKTLTNVANAGLPASLTYTGATTTALNSTFTVDATNFFLPSSITVTMGGTPLTVGTDYTYNNSTGAFTFSAVITGDIVITATATAKLKSIAITTQPTTRKYFAGESFSSTGAVVTATMGDGSTKAVTASATWTPPATPLAAGTGLTVTASYTENAINQTATTTIDVYSVTVNKVNEDGDAVDVAGVTATWTVGTKALAAGVGSTKYAFKEWQVTGATAASTTSASTTLSNPTANVVVNAVFWKPRVVKWSVNGDDSYNTGSPTTTVAYNGTISTIPTNPSGLVCASTFVAWTDAAHNNGTTAKASTSYYESKLFTAANQFPNITAETTTFYAVFAEGTGAAVNTVMWSEDWTGATSSSGSGTPSPSDARPSAQGDHSGKTVYGGATITYTDGTGTYVRTNENNAGGTAPELLIKGNENWTISGIPTGGAATLTLKYRTNGTLTVSTSTDNVSIGTKSGSNPYTNTITVGSGVTSFNLSFTQTSNRRIDNVSVKVASVNLTNYVTECDANIVSVTYDANGGSTSCTNTTTDKTEDFTVCSSVPTRDYYTFAGWLCSADDEVYQANATIDADAIDADFTLTAQWTPVPYNITYELDEGTNSGSNPATYNVTTATITLQNPTRDHDRFDGWYDNGSFTGDAVTSIPLGSHGDITLYAKWAERHEIIFDADGAATTIYRADDEDLSASVAEQGSVPSDPSAPTACSSKVFVGWSESTIDGETDDEPGDLMKPAAGTVNADKHYYAVWATESSETGTVTVFNDDLSVDGDSDDPVTSRSGWTDLSSIFTNSGDGVRVSAKSSAGSMTIDLSDKSLESTITLSMQVKRYGDDDSSLGLSCMDEGTTASFSPTSFTTTSSSWEDKSCTITNVNAATQSITLSGSTSSKRIYIRKVKVTQTGTVYTYSAYSTSCCATKVTLSENSPEHGTIVFGKTSVGTCGGDKEVSLTITPAAGYQLHSYEVATGSGKVAAKSVSPDIALDNNSSAEQNITLTFAEDANGAYDVTASFTKMAPTAWTWTYKSEAIPNPINLYVGQTATLNATYTPSGLLNSEQNYDVTKSANLTQTSKTYASPDIHYTFRADAAMDDGTVTLTNQINTSLTTTVHVHVDPLPRVHFEDLVHGKEFADVVATLSENALNPNKTTKTSVDWVTPNANTCEENHLHLVGWIRSDWPALVAYLNGTGDAPTTTAIVGAGNDGSGNAYFFAPNASINVLTFNGATFYAVWAEIK